MSYPIHKLAFQGKSAELKRALSAASTAQINERDKGIGYTPLVHALLGEQVECVKILLEHGADPNTRDNYGRVPLSILAEPQPIKDPSAEKRVAIAKLLLEHGADVSVGDNFNAQPLWYAVFNCRKEEDLPFVELLLVSGADPNHKSNNESPLDFANKVQWAPLLQVMKRHNRKA